MHLAPNIIFFTTEELHLDKGIEDLKSQYKDNFWEMLPVERMQINQEQMLPGQAKNANFERAEDQSNQSYSKTFDEH